jgi:cysteinyl-tRNA synthetase
MARNEKRFSESDQIRQRLADLKISLNDGKDPKTGGVVTTWEVVR